MELREAIRHVHDVAENRADLCDACRTEHIQLAEWLEELEQYRSTGVTPEEIKLRTTMISSSIHPQH